MEESKSLTNSQLIALRVHKKTLDRFDKLAFKANMTRSTLMRVVLNDAIANPSRIKLIASKPA